MALATLRPLTEAGRQRGIYALHAAMIADIAERPREAERLVRLALADGPAPSLPLARTMAGILMRAGQQAEAERLLDRLGRGQDDAGAIRRYWRARGFGDTARGGLSD
jgi:predicted Zn-dependent protease